MLDIYYSDTDLEKGFFWRVTAPNGKHNYMYAGSFSDDGFYRELFNGSPELNYLVKQNNSFISDFSLVTDPGLSTNDIDSFLDKIEQINSSISYTPGSLAEDMLVPWIMPLYDALCIDRRAMSNYRNEDDIYDINIKNEEWWPQIQSHFNNGGCFYVCSIHNVIVPKGFIQKFAEAGYKVERIYETPNVNQSILHVNIKQAAITLLTACYFAGPLAASQVVLASLGLNLAYNAYWHYGMLNIYAPKDLHTLWKQRSSEFYKLDHKTGKEECVIPRAMLNQFTQERETQPATFIDTNSVEKASWSPSLAFG